MYHQFILFLKYFQHAEFDWSKTTQSTILASFFYGYIVTQIPAGWLADRFGGRRVFGIGMLIASICTLVFPVCARISVNLVYALRVLLGLSTVRKKIIISKYHKIKLKKYNKLFLPPPQNKNNYKEFKHELDAIATSSAFPAKLE